MKRSFQCRICSIKFPTAQAYGGHMSYHSKLKKAQEREHEEVKNEGMNVTMKGKKHGRVEETEKKKSFGHGSDEYSAKSEFCLGEDRCSDFKKKRN
ncbi:hypothetical protein MA16_Dca007652 [Dendrobium catenatum]|uniref:C2H2-type domain-containing protein n=1 Tax=Dendrobium catenatum TaxID=906689 RepID=A0A2I0X0V4_9ASPA|nr:hypothetical protein MA16_Dca007652 [Dendrobium catenatum]